MFELFAKPDSFSPTWTCESRQQAQLQVSENSNKINCRLKRPNTTKPQNNY